MGSLYGSVEDRIVRSHGFVPQQQQQLEGEDEEDPRQTNAGVNPPLKLRAKHGVVVAIVLGAMLLGCVSVSKARVEGMQGGGGAPVDVGVAETLVERDAAQNVGEGEEPFHQLSLQARNEYGVFDALALYGLDMVVEPYKETVLSVSGREEIVRGGGGGGSGSSRISSSIDPTTEHFEAGGERQSRLVSTGGGGDRRRGSNETPQKPALNVRATRLHWTLIPLDREGNAPVPFARPILDVVTDGRGGGGAGDGSVDGPTITLTQAGTMSLLTVTEVSGEDGRVVGEGRATVSCRYVRRELRTLTTEDREAFLDAMATFYTEPSSAGGGDTEIKRLEKLHRYQHFVEIHNSQEFCYHNGMMFLTAHLAFDWVVERALQSINPAVSLAFWDFTIESGTLGADWPQSTIFGPDMFGSALGSADHGFMISDGRFDNISSIYDPESRLAAPIISPIHNPYGYIGSRYDFQDKNKLTRTHSFCGFTGTSSFPKCDRIIDCFDENKSLQFWSKCFEDNIHANMHGWLGGSWGCKMDMGIFQSEHPEYTDDLLVFILQFITASSWPTNGLFSDYNECDSSCERGSDESCGCRCLIDADTMSDDEVYGIAEAVMVQLGKITYGDKFVVYDASKKYAHNFIQDGEPLDEAELLLLARALVTVGCVPGKVGAMATGASPLDPLFWTLHPLFERALHVLWLSPRYRDSYDFSWKDGTCYGSGFTDELPFTEHALGQGPNAASLLTNEDILRIAHPSNPTLPYVYDNFEAWGTCTGWNPCPECTGGA